MEPSAGLPDPEHHGKPRIRDAVAVPCRGPRAGTRDRPRAPAVAGPYLGQRLGRSPRGLRCRSGDGVVFPSGLELPPCRHPALPALPHGCADPRGWVHPLPPSLHVQMHAVTPSVGSVPPPPSAFPVFPMHGPPPYTLSPAHAGAHPAPSTPTEMGGPAASSMGTRPRANPTIRCKLGWGGKGSSPSPGDAIAPAFRVPAPAVVLREGDAARCPPTGCRGGVGGGHGGGPAQPPG